MLTILGILYSLTSNTKRKLMGDVEMSQKSIYLKKYEENFNYIKTSLDKNFDLRYRKINTDNGYIMIICIESITDPAYISNSIIRPLTENRDNISADVEFIKAQIITSKNVGNIESLEHAVKQILFGNVVILFSFSDKMIYADAKAFNSRAIQEPPAETVIKGPREGFTENIGQNISLVRRRIRNPKLKLEKLVIGDESDTPVVMIYIEDRAPKQLVEFVRQRLETTEVKFLLSSNYLDNRLIENRSPFDTLGNTEKPDILVAKVTEGSVAILVDGTPFAITAPHFFAEYFQTPDDYYLNKYGQNYFRLIRWSAFLISLLLPGFYLALISHHFKLIPYIFTFRMAVTRSGVPFPAVIEIIIMMFFFQLLREAGIRLPQPIGSALSIVGALILGDAAIGAGLTSQITVLIIALSSITMFLVPKMYSAVSIWSNIILAFSAVLGLPGFYIGFILFVSHIAGLQTCGYPFLYPFGTYKKLNFGDLILRDDLDKISKNILQRDEEQ